MTTQMTNNMKQTYEVLGEQMNVLFDLARGVAPKQKEIPTYDGSLCTSSCGKDYDCPHGEAFDKERGIRRSGLDFTIKSEK
mgnify:CR=1 FL=1